MGKTAETAPHEDTPLELGPTPHPNPWDGPSTPRSMLAVLFYGRGATDGPIGPWAWVTKMGVLQNFSTIFLPWSVPGVSIPHHFLQIYHSKEVLHWPIDQIVGINHIDEVAPPQVPSIYTKMVGNVLNTTICDL
jgi:hypothetical protein